MVDGAQKKKTNVFGSVPVSFWLRGVNCELLSHQCSGEIFVCKRTLFHTSFMHHMYKLMKINITITHYAYESFTYVNTNK